MASALKFQVPVQGEGIGPGQATGIEWLHVAQIVEDLNGSTVWGRQKLYTGFSHDTEYLEVLRNRGSGGKHLWVQKSTDASTILQVTDTGLSLTALAVSGNATVGGTLGVTGNATVGGTLGVTGALTGSSTVQGTRLISTVATGTAPLTVTSTTKVANLNADLFDDLDSTAFALLSGATFSGNVTVQGNTALGDANTDTLTVIGATTFRNAANTATQLFVDAVNNRAIVGSATALTGAADDKFTVTGGSAYVAANGAATALGVRFVNTNTGSFFVGASNSNTPDGIFSNATGTQIARMFTGGGLLVGTNTSLAGSERLEVQTGGLRVTAGGILLAGSGNIDGNGGTAGQLRIGAVIVNAASLDGSEELLVNGQSKLKGSLEVTTGGASIDGGAIIDTVTIDGTGNTITFNGTSQTQSTVGGAGGASALPATPRGYMKITVGATSCVFPYYDAS